jgi:hypothetical protein
MDLPLFELGTSKERSSHKTTASTAGNSKFQKTLAFEEN